MARCLYPALPPHHCLQHHPRLPAGRPRHLHCARGAAAGKKKNHYAEVVRSFNNTTLCLSPATALPLPTAVAGGRRCHATMVCACRTWLALHRWRTQHAPLLHAYGHLALEKAHAPVLVLLVYNWPRKAQLPLTSACGGSRRLPQRLYAGMPTTRGWRAGVMVACHMTA